MHVEDIEDDAVLFMILEQCVAQALLLDESRCALGVVSRLDGDDLKALVGVFLK